VLRVESLTRCRDVAFFFAFLAPRKGEYGVEIGPDNRRLLRAETLLREPFNLRQELRSDLLAEIVTV